MGKDRAKCNKCGVTVIQNNSSTGPLSMHLNTRHGIKRGGGGDEELPEGQTKIQMKYKKHSSQQKKRRDAICVYLASSGMTEMFNLIGANEVSLFKYILLQCTAINTFVLLFTCESFSQLSVAGNHSLRGLGTKYIGELVDKQHTYCTVLWYKLCKFSVCIILDWIAIIAVLNKYTNIVQYCGIYCTI